jgi:NAD(P)-dependent dehydrogenase (short-subunit alcohol dehydrogenase family)
MSKPLPGTAEIFDVKGKVAIVTGASGAFGAVASRVLAQAGAKLVLAAGKQAELDEVAAECRQLGAEVETINRRPNTEADCQAIMQAGVKRFGSLDILVVASGMNDVSMITEMSLERFEKVMDGNVTGAWLLCREFGKIVIPQNRGGKVVLVSSARGLLGHPAGYSAYCTSKSATDGLTKALGCEWGKYGITVNAIAPTVFRSPLTEWMFKDDEKARTVRAGFLSRVPLGRLGEPEDLAGPLLFLASRASDFYTGHILYADGGYTAG